jgi:hypothetical protein
LNNFLNNLVKKRQKRLKLINKQPLSIHVSLRRTGNPNKQRLYVTQPHRAIINGFHDYCDYNAVSLGPSFGHDIFVDDNSNQNGYSYSYLGYHYQLPKDLTFGSVEAKSYLAGSENWQTTEIEVYQLSPFVPYSISIVHNGFLYIQLYYYILYLYLNSNSYLQ